MNNFLNKQNIVFNNTTISIESIIFYLALFIALIIAINIIKRIVKYYSISSTHTKHVLFLIKLPKEKPGDDKKDDDLQKIKEEIAKGETLFASIGGLKAERGIKSSWLGRKDHFSFEIVAHKNKIAFYISSPINKTRYIEQQIHAHYPEAVIEEIEDYNAFDAQNQIVSGWLKTTREFIFPIKTYTSMDTDPMNSIINVMSKLDKDESIAVQYIVRSARSKWHKRIRDVVLKAYRTNSMKEAIIPNNIIRRIMNILFDISKEALPKQESTEGINNEEKIKRLSNAEEEMLKTMEDKNAKAGLDVNLRIIVSAKNKGKAELYLENIGNAFSEYNNYEYGNSFKRINRSHQQRTINDFIYRRFKENISMLFNTEELNSLFHLPLKHTETPNILWLTAKKAPAPDEVPNEGISLGENIYRGVRKDIRIKREDRRRHTYIVGKSGVGKSVLLTNMAVQDILNGEGVCVLDPHGDLITDILERIPPERAEDVILFSPADLERPLGLNLLEYDPKYPEQKTFVINELIGILDKLYDLKATGGPMFEQYMRNALLLIMDDPESGSTLMEVPKVLSDPKFRRMKLDRCKNITVVDFWKKEAEKAGGDAALANIVPYITSKLTTFISNDMMRPIIGQQKNSFNLREIMDKQKILLIDLPKGVIGEMNAYLLGMILVGKILMASLSRADIPKEERKDFYLYIDEFQNFTTSSICQILSEARKYSLNLTMAHQYIGQLSKGQDTEIKDSIFGNVGTMITFKVGSEDAEYLSKEFSPTFNEYDLINISKGTAYIKLLVDNSTTRAFSLQTTWPLLGNKNEEMIKRIRSLSRMKHGKDKNIIEAEIRNRSRVDIEK